MVPSMRIVSRTCPGAVARATWLMSIVSSRQIVTPPRRRASLSRYQESDRSRRGWGAFAAGTSPLAWGSEARPRVGRWVAGALSVREERPAVSADADERARGRTGREPLV